MQIKLLFDQNLSFKLCDLLSFEFPNSSQLRLLNLDKSSDTEVWEYAKKSGFAIVTQDSDFYHFSMAYGAPPKIIWLRCGNKPTKEIAQILKNHKETIFDFAKNSEVDCLEIY